MPGPRKEGEKEKFEVPREPPSIKAAYDFSILEAHLRKRTLLNNPIPGFYPYLPSKITLEDVPIRRLHPCALYVLKEHLKVQKGLADSFLEIGIDIFNLPSDKAVIQFDWGVNKGQEIWPPIIEESEDDRGILIITDGLHRVKTAKENGLRKITVVLIRNTAAPLPVLPVEWKDVKKVDIVPRLSIKRKFRFQNNPSETLTWHKKSDRNLERFLSGFDMSDPFVKLQFMHIDVKN